MIPSHLPWNRPAGPVRRKLLAAIAGLAAWGCSASPEAVEAPKGPLALQLEARAAATRTKIAPENLALITRANQDLEASGIVNAAMQVGDKAPDFRLPDSQGQHVSLSALLQEGPVVLTFYRGHW